MSDLLDLPIGAEFIVCSDFFSIHKKLVCTVVRKTATQIIDNNGYRWNKHGNLVGDTYSFSWNAAYVATPEKLQQVKEDVERERLRKWVNGVSSGATLAQLRAMRDAFDALAVTP